MRTIQRLEAGEDVSLDTLASISNALSVKVSDLFESIDKEEREIEIMDISKEQATQLNYRKKKVTSINLIVTAIIGYYFLFFIIFVRIILLYKIKLNNFNKGIHLKSPG
ncbi:hypothetical protein OF800_10445 [Lactococcus garvieae]|uniref:HTH cro/C1-type domain-containing protein n=1 Tax=Lactococcus garvieae TaxID=1363 RepID=A0AA46YUG5_9LACT|nr:helix-turn-helix domain-containing protein [Lactococcus garvieae]UYT10348.1 hypothetical protein OF801_10470 [Lactococcus garvieae]UYT12385.1 hypothetical protein OF800_10445 [Lactococcus garvieae]